MAYNNNNKNSGNQTVLRAPFNFVPLNDEVFFPDWADQVSQDVPFSDGLSGTLDLTIETKSPIFIKNGARQEKDDDKKEKHYYFSHTEDGRYFIPATSIKGAIRSVLEIISFGKLTQVQEQSFGIRDLSNGKDGVFYRNILTKTGKVRCGWMWKEGNQVFLDDCGEPFRISAEVLEAKYGVGFLDFVMNSQDLQKDENRTAKKKYKLFDRCNLCAGFQADYELNNNRKMTLGGRKFVKFGGDFKGTIVFTGQSSARQKNKRRKDGTMGWSGKFFEFVFPDQVEHEKMVIDSSVFKSFESIHQNSPDYKDFRKGQLYRGERIPVFFNFNKEKEVDSIGLAYMYKYPANKTVLTSIRNVSAQHLSKSMLDMPEILMGFVDANNSMKGRVQFCHAFLDGQPIFGAEKKIALSKPHPSYYPLYLGDGETWNTQNTRLAGRKRYPVRNRLEPNEGTDGMLFYINPLAENNIFKGCIRFHNLRPFELGALLNAINFWNDNNYFHNLGQGKPLGYGKVVMKATVNALQSVSDEYNAQSDYVSCFQDIMRTWKSDWDNSVELRELKLMAQGIPEGRDGEFTYMKMSTTPADNEFKKGKDEYAENKRMGYFSEILSGKVSKGHVPSDISIDTERVNIDKLLEEEREKERRNNERKKQKEEEEKAILKKEEERKQAYKIYKDATRLKDNKQYEEAISKYEEAEQFGLNDYSNEKAICKLELEKIQKASGGISDFLNSINTIASPAAFANHLKKRTQNAELTEDDLPVIAKFLNEKLAGDKKLTAQWQKSNNWSNFLRFIGEESTKKLFELVNGTPM